jgi:hypothetical protein
MAIVLPFTTGPGIARKWKPACAKHISLSCMEVVKPEIVKSNVVDLKIVKVVVQFELTWF